MKNKNFTEKVEVGKFATPASIYKALIDKGLITQPGQLEGGGEILKALAPSLAGLATSLIPGGASFAPVTSSLVSEFLTDKTNVNNEPFQQTDNPYGQMRNGGNIVGYKQYDAPSHENGGLTVNESGIPTTNNNLEVEVEKKENAYKYSVLPDYQGSTYVFSDKNKTADLVKKIIKDYNKTNKNSDLDFPTRTAMEFDISRVQNRNELIKSVQETLSNINQEIPQAKSGKKIKEYQNGGGISPLIASTPNDFELDLTQLVPDTSFKGTSLTPDLSINPKDLFKTQVTENNIASNIFSKENLPKLLRTAGLVGGVVDAFQPAQKEEALLPDFQESDEAFNRMSANLTAAEQAAANTYNLASNINKGASSSFGQYRARQLGSLENYQDQLQDISVSEQQLRNQILSTQGQYNLNKALTTRGILDENVQRNLANVARSQDFKRQAFSDIVGEADRLSTQNNLNSLAQAKTSEGLAILKNIAPDFSINEDYVKNLQLVAQGKKDASELSDVELILFNKLKNQ